MTIRSFDSGDTNVDAMLWGTDLVYGIPDALPSQPGGVAVLDSNYRIKALVEQIGMQELGALVGAHFNALFQNNGVALTRYLSQLATMDADNCVAGIAGTTKTLDALNNILAPQPFVGAVHDGTYLRMTAGLMKNNAIVTTGTGCTFRAFDQNGAALWDAVAGTKDPQGLYFANKSEPGMSVGNVYTVQAVITIAGGATYAAVAPASAVP